LISQSIEAHYTMVPARAKGFSFFTNCREKERKSVGVD
jgi:hypothetical protein